MTVKRLAYSCSAFFLLFTAVLFGQTASREGKVVSISGKTIIAEFSGSSVAVGDEVDIVRPQKIIDPVTGKSRGEFSVAIGKGIIVDYALNKASLRVDSLEGKNVSVGDTVILTGKEKKIIKPEGPRSGEIQEISEETIVTSLGSADEISPGDIFLIQRNEPIYDTTTNEVIGTNSVNVGRYSVDTVSGNSSVARVIEQNLVPQKTDIVYKESEYLSYLASSQPDSLKIVRLTDDVESLKHQLKSVKGELDSLKREHEAHMNEFIILKNDIESFIGKMMKGDLRDVKVQYKNAETPRPLPVSTTDDIASYSTALKHCLSHEHETAIREFNNIIARNPESRLTENCRYWIAQSYFNMKAYPQALDGFQTVVRDTRFRHKDDDAAIMIGITYLMMNEPGRAREEFERFRTDYPQSEYVPKIDYWIGKLSSSG